MSSDQEIERTVRAALAAGDSARAVDATLRAYGAELFGFFLGVVEDEGAARRVYSDVVDRAARDLSVYAWRCSLRVWIYGLGRRELWRRRASGRPRSASPSSLAPTWPEPTTTISRRSTRLRLGIAALRGELLEEERELLILRIGRGLEWRELALTALGEDATPMQIARESERVRSDLDALRAKVLRAADRQRLIGPG